jgi:hypothetical protein
MKGTVTTEALYIIMKSKRERGQDKRKPALTEEEPWLFRISLFWAEIEPAT